MSEAAEPAASNFESARKRIALFPNFRYQPRRYRAWDKSLLYLQGPFEDEPAPLSPSAWVEYASEQSQTVVTGLQLKELLKAETVKYEDRGPRVDYELYRARAIRWRGHSKKLLPDELRDPRNFEARVCRIDPKGPNASWFFPLGDWAREQLVIHSRKSNVRYLSPGELEPGPEFFARLRKVYFDVCRFKRIG